MMRRAWDFMTIMVVVAFLPASATIINIPGDYLAIQAGINASSDGDTVLVQPGTYVENVDFNGHNIVLGSLFLTTADTNYIEQTVIDGGGVSRVITFENGENNTASLLGFTIQNGNSSLGGGIRCLSSSPTISNNIVLNNNSDFGGGINCQYSSPDIISNIISDNTSSGNGGGISCAYGSDANISNNLISRNSARTVGGGGIFCLTSSPSISDNVIDSNRVQGSYASGHGGAICCRSNSNPEITNNILSNNTIDGGPTNAHGAGIDCDSSNPVIRYNTIINNRCLNTAGFGGGIKTNSSNAIIEFNLVRGNLADSAVGGIEIAYSGSSSIVAHNIIVENTSNGWCGGIGVLAASPRIYNNIICDNSATRGGGLICFSGANPVLMNNIFWGDSASIEGNEFYIEGSSPVVSYCDIEGGWPGVGNLSLDPLFRDRSSDDFHLMSTECGDPYDSPCIDAGHPDSLDAYMDCLWGLSEERADIGAYGGGAEPQTEIRNPYSQVPARFVLSQNYPNPFNAQTTISYSLPEPGDMTISIYNLLGQRVATLREGPQEAGEHTGVWDAVEFPSGVYFARLETAERSDNIKMVLLK